MLNMPRCVLLLAVFGISQARSQACERTIADNFGSECASDANGDVTITTSCYMNSGTTYSYKTLTVSSTVGMKTSAECGYATIDAEEVKVTEGGSIRGQPRVTSAPQVSGWNAGGSHTGRGGRGTFNVSIPVNEEAVVGHTRTSTLTCGGDGGKGDTSFTPRGGGVVNIKASAKVTIDGVVSVNGDSADSKCNQGGGAGGSVRIVTKVLNGNGKIEANGGNGGAFTGGGGAGGNVILFYEGGNFESPSEDNAEKGVFAHGGHSAELPAPLAGNPEQIFYESCERLLEAHPNLKSQSGTYVIKPIGGPPISVYCDMATGGGGWTLCAKYKKNENQPFVPRGLAFGRSAIHEPYLHDIDSFPSDSSFVSQDCRALIDAGADAVMHVGTNSAEGNPYGHSTITSIPTKLTASPTRLWDITKSPNNQCTADLLKTFGTAQDTRDGGNHSGSSPANDDDTLFSTLSGRGGMVMTNSLGNGGGVDNVDYQPYYLQRNLSCFGESTISGFTKIPSGVPEGKTIASYAFVGEEVPGETDIAGLAVPTGLCPSASDIKDDMQSAYIRSGANVRCTFGFQQRQMIYSEGHMNALYTAGWEAQQGAPAPDPPASNTHTINGGAGYAIHGPFDSDIEYLTKTLSIPSDTRNGVEVKLRFWAVDDWDGDEAFVAINGERKWSAKKLGSHEIMCPGTEATSSNDKTDYTGCQDRTVERSRCVAWNTVNTDSLATESQLSAGSGVQIQKTTSGNMPPGTNVAHKNTGAIAFASGSQYCTSTAGGINTPGSPQSTATGIHCFKNINDGIKGNSNSWITNSGSSRFVGIRFSSAKSITGFALGRDQNAGGHTDRTNYHKTVEVTTVANPDHNTVSWTQIGSNFMVPARGIVYNFSETLNVTGIRILVNSNEECIDELEVFGSDFDSSQVPSGVKSALQSEVQSMSHSYCRNFGTGNNNLLAPLSKEKLWCFTNSDGTDWGFCNPVEGTDHTKPSSEALQVPVGGYGFDKENSDNFERHNADCNGPKYFCDDCCQNSQGEKRAGFCGANVGTSAEVWSSSTESGVPSYHSAQRSSRCFKM
jgi:hypothetical protein